MFWMYAVSQFPEYLGDSSQFPVYLIYIILLLIYYKKKCGPNHVVSILPYLVLTSLVQATWPLVVCVLHLTLILMTRS